MILEPQPNGEITKNRKTGCQCDAFPASCKCMRANSRGFAVALAFSSTAIGGPASFETFEGVAHMPESLAPAIDGLVANHKFRNETGVDIPHAGLDGSQIGFCHDCNLRPALECRLSSLAFTGTRAGFPMSDEDLHKFGIRATVPHESPVLRRLEVTHP
ncbi:MAG: hypothetical protein MUC40_00130 [Akkermansiaceae bacterium]|nr:hypothetical protein [Akkermansiaceae bacterium]